MVETRLSDKRDIHEQAVLQGYFETILRYKWIILLLAISSTILSMLVVSMVKPTYRAVTTLMIEAEPAKILSVDEIYAVDASRTEYYLTQFEILKSRSLAAKVIDHLGLLSNVEFLLELQSSHSILPLSVSERKSSGSGKIQVDLEREKQAAIDYLLKNLTVKPILKTQLVKINFDSWSPELAANISDAFAQSYIDSYLEAKADITSRATVWMNKRLGQIKSKLEQSESKLQAFREKEGLVELDDDIRTLAAIRVKQLVSQISELQKELSQKQSLYQSIIQNQKNNKFLLTLPEIAEEPLILELRLKLANLLGKVSELAKRYGPKHPRIIAANAEIEAVQNSINLQVVDSAKRLIDSFLMLQQHAEDLDKKLAKANLDYQVFAETEIHFKELLREVESNRHVYNAFLMRIKETSELSGFESANARVIDFATLPYHPVKPRKKVIFVLTFIFSIGVGMVLALLSEAIIERVRDRNDVRRKINYPALGVIPTFNKPKNTVMPSAMYLLQENNQVAEAVRSIRTSWLLSQQDKHLKTIAVLSSIAGEGKSTAAINIAYAFSQMEKVLLIDADLRSPCLAKMFNKIEESPGLTTAINHPEKIGEIIYQSVEGNLDLITAGDKVLNPQELLACDNFTKVLQKLYDEYDRIIIDTSALQEVSDAYFIAKQAQSNIFVVNAKLTPVSLAQNTIAQLKQAEISIDGVIVNEVKK